MENPKGKMDDDWGYIPLKYENLEDHPTDHHW